MGGIALAAAAIFTVGPAYLRQGALAVLVPVSNVEAASPYRIDVKPGNATVARGADVTVTAKLSGFTATEVDLFTRAGAGAPFERAPMVASGDDGAFETVFFGLRQSLDYFVQAAGVRSPVFRIEAAELPFVERLELEYVFPAYTGLEPRQVEDGGDIAVLRGTTVRLRVHSTLATKSGRIVRGERDETPLAVNADGTLSGSFEVREDGIYRIDLASPAGTLVSASPQYTIDVLDDEAPVVSFSKPGRDLRATSIDEVFVEAQADDDFGVARLDLVYAVNGGAEKQRAPGGWRRDAREGAVGRPHVLPRGAGPAARRRRVVLRARHRQRHGHGREERDERHLLPADPAVPQGLPRGREPGRRPAAGPRAAAARTTRRRSPSSSAASSRARSTSCATGRRSARTSSGRTSCSWRSRRAS